MDMHREEFPYSAFMASLFHRASVRLRVTRELCRQIRGLEAKYFLKLIKSLQID
jgi:hypothetical protein